ncbi:uncharacterized protein [Medicago truncatula]|uniref:uncharacterized protein n=1 Tax=Medicago truncatula TaxID=3880 RepID=UPI0019677689|nr:uncharacterized protein LOC25496100 [Medicago truncatula]
MCAPLVTVVFLLTKVDGKDLFQKVISEVAESIYDFPSTIYSLTIYDRKCSHVSQKQGKSQTAKKYQRYQESNYMDPNQGLCLGALFDIAATNGLDMSRRLCIFGFCRSIEMLSDVVEDTVLEHGGEVGAT